MAYQPQDDGMGFWGGVGTALGGSALAGLGAGAAAMTPMGRAGIRGAATWMGKEGEGLRPSIGRGMDKFAQAGEDAATVVKQGYNNSAFGERMGAMSADPLQSVKQQTAKSLVETANVDTAMAKEMAEGLTNTVAKAAQGDAKAAEALTATVQQNPKLESIIAGLQESISNPQMQQTLQALAKRKGDMQHGVNIGATGVAAGGAAGYGIGEMLEG